MWNYSGNKEQASAEDCRTNRACSHPCTCICLNPQWNLVASTTSKCGSNTPEPCDTFESVAYQRKHKAGFQSQLCISMAKCRTQSVLILLPPENSWWKSACHESHIYSANITILSEKVSHYKSIIFGFGGVRCSFYHPDTLLLWLMSHNDDAIVSGQGFLKLEPKLSLESLIGLLKE